MQQWVNLLVISSEWRYERLRELSNKHVDEFCTDSKIETAWLNEWGCECQSVNEWERGCGCISMHDLVLVNVNESKREKIKWVLRVKITQLGCAEVNDIVREWIRALGKVTEWAYSLMRAKEMLMK